MEDSSTDFTENEIRLLKELSENSSQSNGKLARKLKVHPTTIRRVKKTLENRLDLQYTIGFNLQKIPSYKLYVIFQQLVPGARENEELNRKMRGYYKSKQYIIEHGKCIHGKWDAFTLFYCHENKFDEYFSEFKSRVNLMTEEMEIIRITQPTHSTFFRPPIRSLHQTKNR